MANTNATQGGDAIRDTVASAVGNVVSAMEPQLNKMATDFANQAIDRSKDLAQSAYRGVQRQPWYLVGVAAFLLIGAALLIGFQGRDSLVQRSAS